MTGFLVAVAVVGVACFTIGVAGRNRFSDLVTDALMIATMSCALTLALVPWVAS